MSGEAILGNPLSALLALLSQARALRCLHTPFVETPLSEAQFEALRAALASPGDLKLLASFASKISRHHILVCASQVISGKEILAEIVRVAPSVAVAFRFLAEALADHTETTPAHFPDIARGRNKRWLLEEAHRLDPSDPFTLGRLGRAIGGSEGIDLAYAALKLDPTCYVGYYTLGYLCPSGQMPLSDGRSLTEVELFLEALRFDSNDPLCFYNLGVKRKTTKEPLILPDGRAMTATALFVEAIRLDPWDSDAYDFLGAVLKPGDTVTLADGRCFTEEELYFAAIALDPSNHRPYYNLACISKGGAQTTLPDGRTFTKQTLYIEALKHNPAYSHAYNNLGNGLPAVGGRVTLPDGRTLTRQELHLEAIKYDPTNGSAYNSLAASLPVGASITLIDGRTMTRLELFLTANRFYPDLEVVYVNLTSFPEADGKVTLADGRRMTEQELYLEAIRLNSDYGNATLASLAPPPMPTARLPFRMAARWRDGNSTSRP